MRKLCLSMVVLAIGTLFSLPASAVPTRVAYTGHLVRSGVPFTGNQAVTFKLFSGSTGGSELWSESYPSVAIANGVFTVELGVAKAPTLYKDVHPYCNSNNRKIQYCFLETLKTLMPAQRQAIIVADSDFPVPLL